uniref:Uncharacterized protein n=1 Tax=Rhizophora mucronata TaxID=61149 RepID=A0A2P2NBW6_RHIMU
MDSCCCSGGSSQRKDCGDGSGVSWLAALAFCLGIASVGLAFGCRYLF